MGSDLRKVHPWIEGGAEGFGRSTQPASARACDITVRDSVGSAPQSAVLSAIEGQQGFFRLWNFHQVYPAQTQHST